jgi:hypothetical protein
MDFILIFCVFFFFLAEHMLFFASEKYPVEDSYSTYITEVVTGCAFSDITALSDFH